MTPIELALEKQRLLLQSTALRDDLARHAEGLQPLCVAGDQLRAGVHWLGRHPEVLAGAAAFLAATRSDTRRFIWRWGKRGFMAWRLWREKERWLAAR